MFDSLAKAGKYLGQAAKLMIGMPDYDNYVEHMRVNHPDQTPMTYEERIYCSDAGHCSAGRDAFASSSARLKK